MVAERYSLSLSVCDRVENEPWIFPIARTMMSKFCAVACLVGTTFTSRYREVVPMTVRTYLLPWSYGGDFCAQVSLQSASLISKSCVVRLRGIG